MIYEYQRIDHDMIYDLFDIQVVLGTLTSYFWGMEDKFGVSVVGDIPTG